MSSTLRITGAEYDRMIAAGAFKGINRRIELIHGELREMTPAGLAHEDIIDYLTRWSTQATVALDYVIRVQSSIDLGDSRPEPDITWLKPGRYSSRRPRPEDVLLVIEVADCSLLADVTEKCALYASSMIAEYWVIDITKRVVRVFTESDGRRYGVEQIVHAGQILAPRILPTAALDLCAMFVDP